MSRSPRSPVALGTAAAALLLLLAAASPRQALHQLDGAWTAGDPAAPLVALLSLLAWLLAGWLALTVLLTAGAHLPGLVGRLLAAVSRRCAPAAVRRAVEAALGLTVAVSGLGASPALAAPGPVGGPAAPAAVNLDWAAPPAPAESGPPQHLDWPGSARADHMSRLEPVVVRPGDTLWGLAEHALAARSDTAPSDAEVAQAWPAWWAANRDAVGDDPDLIVPGTPLTPPPADGSTAPASS